MLEAPDSGLGKRWFAVNCEHQRNFGSVYEKRKSEKQERLTLGVDDRRPRI